MTRINRIKQILSALKPQYLKIIDQTPNHAGHLSQNNLLETHLTLLIVSDSLNNMSLVQQHRIIKDMLKAEFDEGMHALSIKVLKTAPEIAK